MKLRVIITALIVPCLSLEAKTKTTPAEIVKTRIKEFTKKYTIPGAAVALYTPHGEQLLHFGYADVNEKKQITEDTIFEIGSISKIFTCLLVAEEVLYGQMKLNEPVGMHIPALSKKHLKQVTLGRLASHTSTLPWNPPSWIKSEDELLQHIARWKPKLNQARCQYSNHGIELLRIALEESTEQSINDLLIERILFPLGMAPIGIDVPDAYSQYYADCYDKAGAPTIKWQDPILLGSAAIRSTSKDMLQFLKAALGLPEIDPQIKEAMRLTQTPYVSVGDFMYGLAWEIKPLAHSSSIKKRQKHSVYFLEKNQRRFNGNLLCEKMGTTEGFHAYIGALPHRQTGIVIMINKRVAAAPTKIKRLGKQILKEILEL